MSSVTASPVLPTWLRLWAGFTVCAAVPLLLLGAEVTTRKVGMVDPRGFRVPWHLLEVSWAEKGLGYLIEHGHRLAGFGVGTCVIVLAVGLWLAARRSWLSGLGLLALLAVSLQGVLGIFRIELNALMGTNLALVHGLFAQLVFALLVCTAVVMSLWWQSLQPLPHQESSQRRLLRTSLLAAGLILGQIILGALVRHHDYWLAGRAHLLGAFAVTAVVVWLLRERSALAELGCQERAAGSLLAVVLTVQLLLGVESWLSKFASVETLEWRQLQPLAVQHELLRSIHYFTGSLLLATTLVMALQAWRRLPRTIAMLAPASSTVEAAA